MARTAFRAISTNSFSRQIAMPLSAGHDDGLPAQEVRQIVGIEHESLLPRLLQGLGNIGILHESVLHAHVEQIVAERLD